MTQLKKRRRANKHGAGAITVARSRKEKKEKASSEPSETTSAKQPIYLVVEHGDEEPTHSVIEIAAGGASRRLRSSRSGMSFTAVGTPYGPRIVGLGLDRTTLYDPKSSTEHSLPRLVYSKMHPVLITHGCKLYALSRRPSVVPGRDFMPWFHVLDLSDIGDDLGWRGLPPPPIFPCRINPLEYRDRIEGTGTCSFDVDAEQWEMVDGKNLPFSGQAVPLGGHRFVAPSKEKGGAAAVYYIKVFRPGTSGTGKTELSIVELPVISNGIVPGQLLCSMGKGRFSSFNIRSIDPGPDAKLDKAQIVRRTYYEVEVEGVVSGSNSVVIAKQQKQIFNLENTLSHLAYPSPVVAALTMGVE
ncbi:uncharacterized protein LOC119279582 [Triticum dicoccoides]|uniref:uncharacterized protein LOC119279582 n=1 Tax=Triticum dicoccoides TaxID=85692 RepID=UPI00188FA909|nr:uncharacterized protein LOC119279582 [Triticum dicoccoides]